MVPWYRKHVCSEKTRALASNELSVKNKELETQHKSDQAIIKDLKSQNAKMLKANAKHRKELKEMRERLSRKERKLPITKVNFGDLSFAELPMFPETDFYHCIRGIPHRFVKYLNENNVLVRTGKTTFHLHTEGGAWGRAVALNSLSELLVGHLRRDVSKRCEEIA